MVTFIICLTAALALNFLREGFFSRVYAQFVIIPEPPRPQAKSGYPAPAPPSTLKSPYPVSGKPDRAAGPYPAPVSRSPGTNPEKGQ